MLFRLKLLFCFVYFLGLQPVTSGPLTNFCSPEEIMDLRTRVQEIMDLRLRVQALEVKFGDFREHFLNSCRSVVSVLFNLNTIYS